MEVYHFLRSCMLLSSGRIQEAIESLDMVLTVYKDYGGVLNAPSTYITKVSILFLNGEFEEHRDNLLSIYQVSTDHSDEANMLGSSCCMIQSLILGAPEYPEGATDVNNWIKSLQEIYDTWPDAKTSPFHLINITSTFLLCHSYISSTKTQDYEANFSKGLEMFAKRIESHNGFSVAISIFVYLIAQHRFYEIRDPDDWNKSEALRKIQQVQKILKKLCKLWSFVKPIIHFADGLSYLFREKGKQAEESWRKGVQSICEISDDLEFIKAVLQVRILRYSTRRSKDLQSMKTKTAEFLEDVGARAELAFLNNETFTLQQCINSDLDIDFSLTDK